MAGRIKLRQSPAERRSLWGIQGAGSFLRAILPRFPLECGRFQAGYGLGRKIAESIGVRRSEIRSHGGLAMKASVFAVMCGATMTLVSISSPSVAQQKTVKQCQAAWRANKAEN
jgi:hypothetical protein